MLKICGKSICGLLRLILNECISNGVFAPEWQKGKLVPIHKKTTNNVWKTTAMSCYYQFVAKS